LGAAPAKLNFGNYNNDFPAKTMFSGGATSRSLHGLEAAARAGAVLSGGKPGELPVGRYSAQAKYIGISQFTAQSRDILAFACYRRIENRRLPRCPALIGL
jgi:hypothetical protein